MLDPMVNGRYDWMDINGGSWVLLVAAGWVTTIGLTAGALWMVRHPTSERALDGWQEPGR